MTSIFVDISLILALVTVLAAILHRLKQPLVLAYLLVGILAASSGIFPEITSGDTLDFFAELGIAFVLFLIGLELKFSDIRQIGRAAVFVGISQIVFTSVLGFIIARSFLGLPANESLYLGLALTFSSTIIVVKLLEQKRDLDSLYGKITVGYLIVQDFVAIAALIFLTSIGGGEASGFLISIVKGIFLVALILVLNRYVLRGLFDILAKNTEVLFLASISWALVFSSLSASLGFSIEIGAFLAGLGLANIRQEQQVASWIRPLRNLFVILFFISLGLKLSITTFISILGSVALLSTFVLVGNPIIILVVMGILGFRSRTSFHVAATSAQVSEFSLIVVFLGNRLGFINDLVVNLTVATALVTIVLSTYLILYSSKIYRILSPYLKIFQRKVLMEKTLIQDQEFTDHIVLVGAGRLGWNLLKGLQKKGNQTVVVDFDPKIIKKLEVENTPFIYGDISDQEIFEFAVGKSAKMIISTVLDIEATHSLLSEVKRLPNKVPVIVTSNTVVEALEFYKEGASYVIIPRILSSSLVEKFLIVQSLEDLRSGTLRKEHIEQLSKIELDHL